MADALTDRQREVAGLVAAGLTNREVAEQLGISKDGVKYHVAEILSRLGVSSRASVREALWGPPADAPAQPGAQPPSQPGEVDFAKYLLDAMRGSLLQRVLRVATATGVIEALRELPPASVQSHRGADGHRRALRARHPAGAGRAPHRDLPRRHATVPAGAAAARAAHAGAARLVPRPARQHDAARPRRRPLDRAHPGRRRRAARGGHGQRVGELDPHPAAAGARLGAGLPRRAGTRRRARGRHQRGRGGLGAGTAADRAGAPLPAQPLHGLRPQPHGGAAVGRRRGAGGRRQLQPSWRPT